jgi:hypothetical protein
MSFSQIIVARDQYHSVFANYKKAYGTRGCEARSIRVARELMARYFWISHTSDPPFKTVLHTDNLYIFRSVPDRSVKVDRALFVCSLKYAKEIPA